MNNMTEPTSAAAGAVLATKFGAMLGAGLVGAAVMAAFDPPKTRKELFTQAGCAGIGSMVFGGPIVRILDHYADFVNLGAVDVATYLEWTVPVYFIVGALSWGGFAAVAKLRGIIRDRAAGHIYDKVTK